MLRATRYWRSAAGQPRADPLGPPSSFEFLGGTPFCVRTVRGTGASFGQWYYPWSPQEIADLATLVAWGPEGTTRKLRVSFGRSKGYTRHLWI